MRPAVRTHRLKGVAMTIYSQHSARGKSQILATYRGEVGVVSSTVTSVENAVLAAPIVDALNWISACATVPISVWDNRDGRFADYPSGHIAALTDRNARSELLEGVHSLWYEQVKVLLYQALVDLDEATTMVPPPVLTAITSELETEARGLREALAEYMDGIDLPADDNRRNWQHEAPFVTFDDKFGGLSEKTRAALDSVEMGAGAEQLRAGVADLRLLVAAHGRCVNPDAELDVSDFAIIDDPFDDVSDRYFLNVEAPMPDDRYNRDGWGVQICVWVPDDPADEENRSATGEPVLRCARLAPPTVDEVVRLLDRSNGQPAQLAAWATTVVGDVLAGTNFVVTERFDV
jgi:hypothetical protein